jgi:hypothetical protein
LTSYSALREFNPIAYPPIAFDSIELFINKDPTLDTLSGGGQRGGTMKDYAGFDIIYAIKLLQNNNDVIKQNAKDINERVKLFNSANISFIPTAGPTNISDALKFIIENGPFDNEKSLLTENVYKNTREIITVFHRAIGNLDSTAYGELIKEAESDRQSKIIAVRSWIRSLAKRSNVTEKDIQKLVPDLMTIKQFIDILAELNVNENLKIRINKSVFEKETPLIPNMYVLNKSIKKITDKARDAIIFDNIVDYFETEPIFDFFLFKNVLVVLYDFTLGNKDYDKIYIILSYIINWLKERTPNRLTNKDIIDFQKKYPQIKPEQLVGVLALMVRNKIKVKNSLVRIIDFNAIRSLSNASKVDQNIKLITMLVDVNQVTLPKPTISQVLQLEKVYGTIDTNALQLPTLFVGEIIIESISSLSSLGDINITKFSDSSNDMQKLTIDGDKKVIKVIKPGVIIKTDRSKEIYNNITTEILTEPALIAPASTKSPAKYELTIRNRRGVKSDNDNAKGTLNRSTEIDRVSTISLLREIQGVINKRNEEDREQGIVRGEYKEGEIVKSAKKFVKGTDVAKEMKMMQESREKDKRIELLEKLQEQVKEKKAISDEAEKRFREKLEKVAQARKIKELEDLLKERDAGLAKEYDKLKEDEKNKNDLKKPDSMTEAQWNDLKTLLGPAPANDLPSIISTYKATNNFNVSPYYSSIDAMINQLWTNLQIRKNNKKDKNKNKGRPQPGGYNQTLRNHLRGLRRTYRRI